MKSLLWILQFLFGCHHRHLSRVFTIKHRTYKVCFDCGREFDLPDAHAPVRFTTLFGRPEAHSLSSTPKSAALILSAPET